jgi:hypothetical protein
VLKVARRVCKVQRQEILLTCHGDAHGPQLCRHLSAGAAGEVEHDCGGRPPQLVAFRICNRQLLDGLLLQTCAQQPRCVGLAVFDTTMAQSGGQSRSAETRRRHQCDVSY